MARPRKEGLDYIPWDLHAFDDMKVLRLMRGNEPCAVSVFLYLLGFIYGERGYYMEWNEDVPFLISEKFGISEESSRSIVNRATNVGLFDKAMRDKYGILTSRGIQKRYLCIAKAAKRSRVKIREEYALLTVSSEETPVFTEETPVFSEKSTQRKEKERKEKGEEREPAPSLASGALEAALIALTGGANLAQLSALSTLAARHGEENVLDALRIAGERGVKKLSYAEGILKDWAANGREKPKKETAPPSAPKPPRLFSQKAQDEETERARAEILRNIGKQI